MASVQGPDTKQAFQDVSREHKEINRNLEQLNATSREIDEALQHVQTRLASATEEVSKLKLNASIKLISNQEAFEASVGDGDRFREAEAVSQQISVEHHPWLEYPGAIGRRL